MLDRRETPRGDEAGLENWQRAGFGIYIHWPFCAAKCPYCDFNSHVSSHVDHTDWKTAFLSELDRYADEVPGRVVSSIFFGGGTPSLMDPSVVSAIIERIAAIWPLSNDVEITLEANPTSVEASRLRDFKTAGVNRVSLGVQALNDKDLRALGRMHSVDEALKALDVARARFDRTSFDLIYARQNQTLDAWEAELSRALSFEPEHLSLYQLTIEDGTVFGRRHAERKLPGLPSEDLSADMYFYTQDVCEASGLSAYEISNHAVLGAESRHNLIYWRGGDYLGIGPGAHGRLSLGDQRIRTETELLPSTWLESALSGEATERRARIDPFQVAQERFLMGLRLREGVQLDPALEAVLDPTGLENMRDLGFVRLVDSVLSVTKQGQPLLNAILGELLLERPH